MPTTRCGQAQTGHNNLCSVGVHCADLAGPHSGRVRIWHTLQVLCRQQIVAIGRDAARCSGEHVSASAVLSADTPLRAVRGWLEPFGCGQGDLGQVVYSNVSGRPHGCVRKRYRVFVNVTLSPSPDFRYSNFFLWEHKP